MVKFVTIFLCKNTQILNTCAGGGMAHFLYFLIYSYTRNMRNNDNDNREQGAIFFCISKHRIALRIC
jgi:hypothetical protein